LRSNRVARLKDIATPKSESPPNRRSEPTKVRANQLCAIADPTQAAVAAMHKVKTMKRAVKGRMSVCMQTSGNGGGRKIRSARGKKCSVFVNFSSRTHFHPRGIPPGYGAADQ